ncbi:MAG: sodium:proton antiporter [Archangium sp.]
MLLFELVVGLLFVGAILALWADKRGVPYPSLLALVGALIALIPGTPNVTLDAELALALFVAPTLLDAAYDASPRDLRKNFRTVSSLAIVLVLITIVGVAWAARLVVPDLSWAAAIALGALVAPPDASAASAVLRKLRPPHRLLVVLEGESLFNDATSLLIYRVALGAAITGAFNGWAVIPTLLLTCGGGVIAGWLLARLYIRLGTNIQDVSINVLLQFIGTFAVWMLAERLGLSAIITLVAFAMTIAQRMGGRVRARQRIASYAVWEVAVLVLNVLAFVLIGLQLRGIVSRIDAEEWRTFGLCAAAVCVAVIAIRVAWVFVSTSAMAWLTRRPAEKGHAPIIAWSGMRGIVTLAAAIALPEDLAHRDLILFCAFCVVLTTLVLQGLTLGPLMKRLQLHDDGDVAREISVARRETSQAAIKTLDEKPSATSLALRMEYQARLQHEEEPAQPQPAIVEPTLVELQNAAVLAQRTTLRELREKQVIGDDAFHVVEEEIDLLELTSEVRS